MPTDDVNLKRRRAAVKRQQRYRRRLLKEAWAGQARLARPFRSECCWFDRTDGCSDCVEGSPCRYERKLFQAAVTEGKKAGWSEATSVLMASVQLGILRRQAEGRDCIDLQLRLLRLTLAEERSRRRHDVEMAKLALDRDKNTFLDPRELIQPPPE